MNLFWILIPIAVVLGFFWFSKRGIKEKTVRAKIAAKNPEPHRMRGGEDVSPATDYTVVFECEGKRLPFVVSHSFYDGAVIGATGKLTHKRDVFVDFEDDNPRVFR